MKKKKKYVKPTMWALPIDISCQNPVSLWGVDGDNMPVNPDDDKNKDGEIIDDAKLHWGCNWNLWEDDEDLQQ